MVKTASCWWKEKNNNASLFHFFRGSHEWKLKTLEPNMWEFEFLNGLIVLKVEFNQQGKKSRKDKAVKNICFVTTDDCKYTFKM